MRTGNEMRGEEYAYIDESFLGIPACSGTATQVLGKGEKRMLGHGPEHKP